MKSTSGGAPPIGFLASNLANSGHGDRGVPSPAHWSPDSRVIDSALKSVTTTDVATFRLFRYGVLRRLVGLHISEL